MYQIVLVLDLFVSAFLVFVLFKKDKKERKGDIFGGDTTIITPNNSRAYRRF